MAAPTIPTREEPRAVAESKQDTEQQQEPRPFATFLLETNKGRSHEELSRGMQELVAEVRRTGKPGSISYTVTIKPATGREDAVVVTDQIVRKVPKGERATSMFFVTDDNDLVRNDPTQPSIFDTHGSSK
jgi:hypothetical protein